MSNNNTIYTNVIARLYINSRFGQGIGNKRKNHFIFNGALEFPSNGKKLWVDLPDLDHAKASCAITDYKRLSDMAYIIIREIWELDPYESERFLFGQLFELKPKTYVDGFLLYDAEAGKAIVSIWEDETAIATVSEQFPITPVNKRKNGNAPDYFGSNFDLELDVPKAAPTTAITADEALSKLHALTDQ